LVPSWRNPNTILVNLTSWLGTQPK
jgi:hypothetical protein